MGCPILDDNCHDALLFLMGLVLGALGFCHCLSVGSALFFVAASGWSQILLYINKLPINRHRAAATRQLATGFGYP